MNCYPQDWSILILENCTIHKVNALHDIVEAQGVILLFLPPYSPDFNPIEGSFSHSKWSVAPHWCWHTSCQWKPGFIIIGTANAVRTNLFCSGTNIIWSSSAWVSTTVEAAYGSDWTWTLTFGAFMPTIWCSFASSHFVEHGGKASGGLQQQPWAVCRLQPVPLQALEWELISLALEKISNASDEVLPVNVCGETGQTNWYRVYFDSLDLPIGSLH